MRARPPEGGAVRSRALSPPVGGAVPHSAVPCFARLRGWRGGAGRSQPQRSCAAEHMHGSCPPSRLGGQQDSPPSSSCRHSHGMQLPEEYCFHLTSTSPNGAPGPALGQPEGHAPFRRGDVACENVGGRWVRPHAGDLWVGSHAGGEVASESAATERWVTSLHRSRGRRRSLERGASLSPGLTLGPQVLRDSCGQSAVPTCLSLLQISGAEASAFGAYYCDSHLSLFYSLIQTTHSSGASVLFWGLAGPWGVRIKLERDRVR